ncbi:MAG: RsmB/NOP family class I SAM-dependent RNA methyltransferase [Acidimicrobiia bacterium]
MAAIPPAFIERMRAIPHLDAEALFAALDQPSVRGGRINPTRFATVADLSSALGVPLSASPLHRDGFVVEDATLLGAHPLHAAGAYYLQEPSAALPVTVLDPQPGEMVLDLCAAPGGKTTAIAAAMAGEGTLVANEIHPTRARSLATTLDRWGNANAVVTNESPERLSGKLAQTFDRVLVDAPCSGEGLFRRDLAARGEWSERAVDGCARRQAGILEHAAVLTQPGGVLVYSTCTFEEVENELVVRAFLRDHPGWELDPIEPIGGAVEGTLPGTVRVYPHLGAGEGQFVARLRAPDGARRRVRTVEPGRAPGAAINAWNAFANDALVAFDPPGPLILNGTTLVSAAAAPNLAGLAVLRAGVPLGWFRANRMEPTTGLAHILDVEQANTAIPLEGADLDQYLRGEPIVAEATGWTVMTVAGVPLGWGRAQRGTVRSKFPPSWRPWVHTSQLEH